MSRNYLETLVELPWSSSTEDQIDLHQARLDLDKDHCGLENVKKRVLEFLAVRKLKNSLKGVGVVDYLGLRDVVSWYCRSNLVFRGCSWGRQDQCGALGGPHLRTQVPSHLSGRHQ